MSRIISRKSIPPADTPGRTGQKILSVAALITFSMVMASIAFSPAASRHMAGNGTACGYNLQNLKTALQSYATDNGGRYPPFLSLVTPNHLGTIPTCPSAGIDTYSCGYAPGNNGFSLCCVGRNHPELLENMPALNSGSGLVATANPAFKGTEEEKNTDTATSLILLGILSIVSYLTYRKK